MTESILKIPWPWVLVSLVILAYAPNITLAQDHALATLKLHYDGNRLDAELSEVPLRDVVQVLTNAGIRIMLNDPTIADAAISANIRSASLEQGLKIILEGFSYALDASTYRSTAVVLSTPRRRRSVPGTIDSVPATDPREMRSSSPPSSPARPQTLDDFRSLGSELHGAEFESPSNPDNGESRVTDEKRQREAMLQRALDVLESPSRHLYADAIEQLGMIQDNRATDKLINMAQQGPGRYLAAEALARVAAQSRFEDANAVTVLERLSTDPDEDVRRSAIQAMEQMRQTQLATVR
jgi:hypothetical protein